MSKTTETAHAHRKDEHLAIALKQYQDTANAGFDQIRLVHQSLPELDVKQIDISSQFGALKLSTPFYIEAMTGGSARTGKINQSLAEIAAATDIAMAVGSQSIALKESSATDSFTVVRKANPNGLVFANLGAGHSADDANRLVDMIQADALELHINSAQELIMPEGDRQLHWLDNIAAVVAAVPVPVIVKEVGFGMNRETAKKLTSLGVQYVNVSGRGGTNFAKIENERRHRQEMNYLDGWGQSTVESLFEVKGQALHVAASGGIRTPLDILKSLILGADIVGVAGQFLHVLMTDGDQALHDQIVEWQENLRLLYALTGSKQTDDLRQTPFVLSETLLNYLTQRNLRS